MLYRVTTRKSVLNVRSGPGLNFRVVSTLARGATVSVSEERETLHAGLWFRVPQVWVSWLYLTPLSGGTRTHPGSQPLPDSLSYDPRAAGIERRLVVLRSQLEHAEDLFYNHSQAAADEGSRLYEVDPLREYSEGAIRALEDAVTVVNIFGGGGGPDQGMMGIERNHRWMLMKEFERNAARYQREIDALESEITQLRRELGQRR